MKYDDLNLVSSNYYDNTMRVSIITKKHKNKNKKMFLFLPLFVVFLTFNVLFALDLINTPFSNDVLRTIKEAVSLNKPTTDLFDDGTNVSFVAFLFNIKPSNSEVSLKLPLNSNYEIALNEISYSNVLGSPVKSCANGVVKKISKENDVKFIEINHGAGVIVRYSNIMIIGVTNGQKVDGNTLIGTASSSFKIVITRYGTAVLSVSVLDNKIVWGD